MKFLYNFIFIFAEYPIVWGVILIILIGLFFKSYFNKKMITRLAILVVALGSLFASFDMFSSWSELNNKYINWCKECSLLIDKISIVFKGVGEQGKKGHVIFKKDENQYKTLIKIIRLNKSFSMQNPSKIIIWPSRIGHFTSSGVVRLNDGIENEFICTAEILVQWIKDYRLKWFLKRGLISIAFGSLLSIIGTFNIRRKY